MKKLILSMTVFLVCFWFFGYSDHPKAYDWERSELVSKFRPIQLYSEPVNQFHSKSLLSDSQQATEWARIYGGQGDDDARFVIQTSDGGYVVAGDTDSFGKGMHSIWLLKLSSDGDIGWQRTYNYGGSRDLTQVLSVQQANDGGYICVGGGVKEGATGLRVLIFKLFPNGDVEWARISGGLGERGDYVQLTNDGGYIVAGLTGSYGDLYHKDFWLLKLSSNGSVEWQHTYGGRDYEGEWNWAFRLPTILQTSEGGYILAGDTHSFGAGWADIWLIKLSQKGDIEWQRTYGGEESEWLYRSGPHILETNDKGYIVAGETLSFGVGWNAIWIFKVSQKGDILWQRTYRGEQGDRANAIQSTNDGGYIVAGTTKSFGAGNNDFWLLKLSSNGDIKWQRTYGGEFNDTACSLQLTNDEGYIVAGTTLSFGSGRNDILVFKLSSTGELGPGCGIVGSSDAVVSDTHVLPSNTYVTPTDTSDVLQTINISPIDTSCSKKLLCWNLNQPPENVSLKREINRSLFRAEVVYTISWEPNLYNSRFLITEYRIYRKPVAEDDESYQRIDSVSGDTFEYVDYISSFEEEFVYAVTSVDSEGNESPKSEGVGD